MRQIVWDYEEEMYDKRFFDRWGNDKDYWDIVLERGARATRKTRKTIVDIVDLAFRGESTMIFMSTNARIEYSIYADIINFLDERGIKYTTKISPRCQIRIGKALINFAGLDKDNSIKGAVPKQAYPYGLIVFEEATDIWPKLTYKEAWLKFLNVRATFRHPGVHVKVLINYNPVTKHWLQDKEKLLNDNNDLKERLFVTTMYDNPFLDKSFIAIYEGLKETNPELYKLYVKGEWVELGGKVYKLTKENTLEDYASYSQIVIGIDIGYNDATTFVALGLTYDEKEIHVLGEYYHSNRDSNEQLSPLDYKKEYIKFANALRVFNVDYVTAICDSADGGFTNMFESGDFAKPRKIKKKPTITGRIGVGNYLLGSNKLKFISEEMHVYKAFRDTPYKEGDVIYEDSLNTNVHSLDATCYAWDKLLRYLDKDDKEILKNLK